MTYVFDDAARGIAGKVLAGSPTEETLRETLALTIAVVGATEHLYRMVGREAPAQWESLERSAETFTDHFVMDLLAQNDPGLKRDLKRQRRRKLAVRKGALCLVEPDRIRRGRWSVVTMPDDAPIPIDVGVANGLGELAFEVENRLHEHLSAMPPTEPLVLAGQIVGLLSASECLLALFTSNKVAAFCVRLAAMSQDAAAEWP